MTARPDPASFDLSLGRTSALDRAVDRAAATLRFGGALALPSGHHALVARKLGVLALLVGGFLMVPALQEQAIGSAAQAVPTGPAMVAADVVAGQQSARLIARP